MSVPSQAARRRSLDCSKCSEFSFFFFTSHFVNKIWVSFRLKEYDVMDLACFVNRRHLACYHWFTIEDTDTHREGEADRGTVKQWVLVAAVWQLSRSCLSWMLLCEGATGWTHPCRDQTLTWDWIPPCVCVCLGLCESLPCASHSKVPPESIRRACVSAGAPLWTVHTCKCTGKVAGASPNKGSALFWTISFAKKDISSSISGTTCPPSLYCGDNSIIPTPPPRLFASQTSLSSSQPPSSLLADRSKKKNKKRLLPHSWEGQCNKLLFTFISH